MLKEETPYFVFKPEILEKNYREFESLCRKYLNEFAIAYSVKTNGFGGVINKLDELGGNFEVASMDEIMRTPEKAKVFNGCCKSEEELKFAIDGKYLINVDSISEIDKIFRLLKGKEFSVGLRVSLSDSKFGFEAGLLDELIDYCKMKGLNVISLSFHFGTQKNLRHYHDGLREAEKIVSKILGKVKLNYIDIGGGFPDKNQLKNLGIGLEDYFKLIGKYFKKSGLKVILEPGRFLVADAFELITKVCVIKENFGKNFAILDVGINVLSKVTLAGYGFEKVENTSFHPPSLDRNDEIGNITLERAARGSGSTGKSLGLEDNKNKNKKEYILAGPLLFKNDMLGKFYGDLKEGDLIKVSNVGAYCYNLAWEISYGKPKVFIDE